MIFLKLIKSLAMVVILLGIPVTAYGVKANPKPGRAILPDGSVLTLRLNGDEFFHYISTDDGYAVECGPDGFYYYLDEHAKASAVRVSPRESRTAFEREFISGISAYAVPETSGRRSASVRAMQQGLVPTTFPTTGNVRGCVILVEYSDVSFTIPNTREEFTNMLNENGYSKYGGTGSARDWFIEQSSGKFNPTFDVYGPVRLPHPRAYYGENGGNGDDLRAHLMLIDAADILDDEVDFSNYDVDNDGWIDNVFIFYAGYGENLGYGAPSEAVWPHSWDLIEATSVPYMYDGVRLNHYACTNEIDLENKMDGIGTFVHEFSHVLGLPDLYSTNSSSAFTPGPWNVMDEGPYNNDSRTPPNYSAYERYALGWLTPRVIGEPANIRLADISTNTACIIPTAAENEYFLIENRQQKGWDTYIPGHGMLVWHIDYNENIWKYNSVNNTRSHQYVDIEEADNLQSSSNRDGDSFPGTAGITAFTDDTSPSMRSWNGDPQGKPITDIFENNGVIEFKISGGRNDIPPVTAFEATEVGIDCFTASWGEGNSGCQYVLSVYTVSEGVSGRPETTYVPGWEARNMGNLLTAVVYGLKPDTQYRYSVRVLDPVSGLQSVGSNEVLVKTLPATFDYLSPELTVNSMQGSSCSVSWTSVEGADDYLLSLYTKQYGESEKETADFTGGISAIPSGWESSSNLTYANAAYCGEAVPSLRFNTDGQWLNTAAYSDAVHGISFWARGVSASDEAVIELYARGSGNWELVASWPVQNSAGFVCEASASALWPEDTSMLRILFRNGGKGSLAIDDVTVRHGGEVTIFYFGDTQYFMNTVETEAVISDLLPSVTYWLTVTGRQGSLFSKPSPERRIITATSGIRPPEADSLSYTISGRTINVSSPSRLYTMQGICIASGLNLIAPASGIYVLVTGSGAVKIAIK